MSTENNNALRLRKQPSPHSGFTSFKNWIKGAILRNQKEKQPMLIAPPPPTEGTLRRLPSSPKRVPSKRSTATTKRRRSQRYSYQPSPHPHRSRKLFNFNSVSNSDSTSSSTSNSNSDSDSNSNSNSKSTKSRSKSTKSISNKKNKKKNNNNKNKNKKLIITDNNNDSSDDDIDSNNCSDTDSWAEEEISNKDELIIPNINPPLLTSVDKPETSTSTTISNTSSDQDLQQSKSFSDTSSDDSRDDFLENTRIVKGSVEHFAYVRTLRKLRGKDKKRSLLQLLLLNNILDSLSYSQLSDEIREALNHYKNRVYELNRLRRTSIINNNDIISRSTFNDSTSSLCLSSMVNKRLSVILSGVHPTSPISMKYRASYASTKVVMVFDEESNQLVVKDLPMARRRRRLSDLSVLGRSTTSSTTSTNSSQSSLVTLTDDVEQNKYSPITTKEPDSYLSNLVVIQNDDSNDGEEDEEDNVPLFVLKEQFRYSGRSYTYLRNNVSSVEENGPSRVTLAV